jgi:uncharacterized membrane protein YhiD involved in acid resistance
MDEILKNFSESGQAFSLDSYVINILICCTFLYLLSLVYIRYGSSISNRNQLARVLIIVGLTTFIIISIVKSSLALSLGLVGALSIIRFRTAIKEPEELGYFFIAIAIGLGLGANQLLPTIIGFVIISSVIVALNFKKLKHISQNLLITLEKKDDENERLIDQITSTLTQHTNQLELKRFKNSQGFLNMSFLINVSSLDQINRINNEIESQFGSRVDLTFIDNQI